MSLAITIIIKKNKNFDFLEILFLKNIADMTIWNQLIKDINLLLQKYKIVKSNKCRLCTNVIAT